MSPAAIIAIGIGIAAALVVALIAARQAGSLGPEEDRYGRELDAPEPRRGLGRARPGVRQRAIVAIVAAALAAFGAALATTLSHGTH